VECIPDLYALYRDVIESRSQQYVLSTYLETFLELARGR
jgi:hypothetical protein